MGKSKIKVNSILCFFLATSMLVYALRGKYGALLISVSIFITLFLQMKGKKKVNVVSTFYALFLIVYAVFLHSMRSLFFKYYLMIGYLAATILLLNSDIKTYRSLWNFLRIIALFEAVGVYLQRSIPDLYYSIMTIILPFSVVEAIKNRLLSGYYTGFTREVSYTMFLIAIGIGAYIFDDEIQKKRSKCMPIGRIITVLFLVGALFISGKRATILFFGAAMFCVYFIHSDSKMKILRYLMIGFVLLFAIIITYPIWCKLSAMKRIIELIVFIEQKDLSGITNGRIAIYKNALQLWNTNRIFGIGWGNFKYSTDQSVWYAGFDVHNCYLQVLCENGFIGAIPFYILTIISLVDSIKCIIKTRNCDNHFHKWALLCGYVQIFFILYCMTEPILYEYTDYIIYFISINITEIILKEQRKLCVCNITHNSCYKKDKI